MHKGITVAKKKVVIVGCGIVGVSSAIWLQRAGFDVTLVDKTGPAAGAAYGNAGVLAACSVVPVTVPGLLAKAPGMLIKRDSPLFMIWSYLPTLLPWLVKYLARANADDNIKVANALQPLLHDTYKQHVALAAESDAAKYINPGSYIFAYDDKQAFAADAYAWNVRKDMGYHWEELDRAAFTEEEPIFQGNIGYAVKVPDHGRISDPGAYVAALAQYAVDSGARLVIDSVHDIAIENGRATGVISASGRLDCDHVVIATGVWSGELVKTLGFKLPLESERGYHIELVNPSQMPNSPTMIASGKFVTTPMDGRIRCAGVIEFGGISAARNTKPIELLRSQVARIMPGLTYDRVDEWLGHRPAPADSIPYIGAFSNTEGVWGAFGHHHIGLSAGPTTGRMIANMIKGTEPTVPLAPYGFLRSNS